MDVVVYGQHESYWLAFYDFFSEVCGLSAQTDKLFGISEIAKSAGWWTPYKNICWISERHCMLNCNEDGRLHCDTGPALAYPDGWKLWSLGGVLVDEQIVMKPESQTVDQINEEHNEAVRRYRIERFGIMRYLESSSASVLDSRKNDVEGTYEILVNTAHGQRLVTHCLSTDRRYFLSIPGRVETCEQAQRSLRGVNCR